MPGGMHRWSIDHPDRPGEPALDATGPPPAVGARSVQSTAVVVNTADGDRVARFHVYDTAGTRRGCTTYLVLVNNLWRA
jgi:hypothetical protein